MAAMKMRDTVSQTRGRIKPSLERIIRIFVLHPNRMGQPRSQQSTGNLIDEPLRSLRLLTNRKRFYQRIFHISSLSIYSLLREVYPRMPWQDIHSVTDGMAAFDVARNFIERWNFVSPDRITHLHPKDIQDGIVLPKDLMAKMYQHCKIQVVR